MSPLPIQSNPKYVELVKAKNGLSWTLAAITVLVFFGYLMVIAFDPVFIGSRIGPDTWLTWGIVLGIANVIAAIVLTGAYVAIANGRIDRLTRELKAEVRA